MKKILIAIMTVFVIVLSFTFVGCKNYESQASGLTFTEAEGGYVLTGCDKELRSVIVPATYKGKPVVNIGFNAFEDCKMETVWFESGITEIDRAFCRCENLTKVYVPKTVESMSDDFHDCHLALTVYFEGEGRPYNFRSDISTAHVVIDYKNNDVATDGYIYMIQDDAEYGLKNGELWLMNYWGDDLNVKLPSSISYKKTEYPLYGLKRGAFYYTSFLESLYVPDTVKAFEERVFANLRGIVLYCESESVGAEFATNWRENQIVVCDCLVNNVADDGNRYVVIDGLHCMVKPNGMSVVGANNWYGDLNIPSSVQYYGQSYPIIEIGESGFENYKLDSITLPDSLLTVGNRAFYGCKGLKTMVVPSSVITMGMEAFDRCTSLESLTLPFVGKQKNLQTDARFTYIFGYRAYSVPESLKSVRFMGGTVLRANAFSQISLEELVLSPEIVNIEGNAFYNCNVVKPVILPRTLTTVSSTAFIGCNNMTLNLYFNQQPSDWGKGWYGGAKVNWGYTD